MSGIETFLERAKREGADKRPHWEIKTFDGMTHTGAIGEIFDDGVILNMETESTSGNPTGHTIRRFISKGSIVSITFSGKA